MSDKADASSLPGPPFRVGERVAFFPAVIGPTSDWLQFEDAVIDRIDSNAESFQFHFVTEPEPWPRHSQGLENIVRLSTAYRAWRSAWEAALARTGDEKAADRETEELRLNVLAEHPIHGIDVQRFRRRALAVKGVRPVTWGDSIRVLAHAPSRFRPGSYASVVGVVTTGEREQKVLSEPRGTRMLTVEFDDGSSIEIPERLVELMPDTDGGLRQTQPFGQR